MSLTSLLRDSAAVRERLNKFIPPASPTEIEPADVEPVRPSPEPAVPFDSLRHVEDALAGTTTRWIGVAQPKAVRQRSPEPPAVNAPPARSCDVEPIVPPSDPDPKRARLVGVAFDYAARMELAHRAPHARQYEWTASKALAAMPRRRRVADTLTVAAAKRACRSWPKDEKRRFRAIARHAARLAPMDFVYYAGPMVPVEDKSYETDYDSIANEVCTLLSASDRLWTFASAKSLRLNPGLDGGSIGGADADIIADDTIIELKVSVKPRATRTHLRQLIGYACLASWDPALTTINSLAVFNPRFGTMQEFPFAAEPLERMETACFLQDIWRGPRTCSVQMKSTASPVPTSGMARAPHPSAHRVDQRRKPPRRRNLARESVPLVSYVSFAAHHAMICVGDGCEIGDWREHLLVPLTSYPTLKAATRAQRSAWEIAQGGRVLLWRQIGLTIEMSELWRLAVGGVAWLETSYLGYKELQQRSCAWARRDRLVNRKRGAT